MQFQTLSRQKGGGNPNVRRTVKHVPGYTDPTVCILRSREIYCMTYTEQGKELWVSGNGSIDIVNCKDFKVNTDMRINLKILLRMCKIHPELCIGQMACVGSQMFCLLAYSPFVLEFTVDTYECKSILNLEKHSVIWKPVSMDFMETDHEAYHGVTTAEWCASSNTEKSDDSSSSESDDEPNESTSFADTANFWRVQQRAKSQPVSPDHESMESFDNPPSVPLRTKASRKACRVLGIQYEDNVTKSCVETQVVPPRPPRPKTDSVRDQKQDKPPPIPPKGNTVHQYNKNKGICKKSSFSLPNMPKHSGYIIELTSILIVNDSLWIARSCGDICIVNIHRARPGTVDRFGKCVASMCDLNMKQKKINLQDLQLVKTGKHVASAYYVNNGNEPGEVEIAFWESYGIEEVDRIENYWGHILAIEKELFQESKGSKPASMHIDEV